MNNYDGLYILNIQGKDEGLKEAIESIEKEIEGFRRQDQTARKRWTASASSAWRATSIAAST